jgi:hypothetical protein
VDPRSDHSRGWSRLAALRTEAIAGARAEPAFFTTIYTDRSRKKTRQAVEAALDAVDGYMASRAPDVFATVIDYLREAGEARSATEIETHFTRQLGVDGVTTACEYLADQRLIGQASTPARLTKKSTIDVQELAFFYLDARPI